MTRILITRKLMKSSEDYASKIFNVKLNKEDKLLTLDDTKEYEQILKGELKKFFTK